MPGYTYAIVHSKSCPRNKKAVSCAEGTEWWKKARQKQAKTKEQVPLYNEFVDEEVSAICFPAL